MLYVYAPNKEERVVSRNIPFDLLRSDGEKEKEEVWKRWWGREEEQDTGTDSQDE